ncbi:MAG: hypothetical protein AB7G35_17090 [Hyphomicrobiaceae bacterium]
MTVSDRSSATVLVRGVGDVGSAVAISLLRAGYSVAIHDEPTPAAPRRGMAFVDAMFDGKAALDGAVAGRFDRFDTFIRALVERELLPVTALPFSDVVSAARWSVLVDARLRKRSHPEHQIGLAALTVGLGPNFVAGENVDLAIETSWGERLGAVITRGPTLALAGEPRPIAGIGRARFVYAPVEGCFETTARIGDSVLVGQPIANIGNATLFAPLAGIIRGLTHSGVPVSVAAKVIEIDPRGDPSAAFGLGERPKRIAEGVCRAIARREALDNKK